MLRRNSSKPSNLISFAVLIGLAAATLLQTSPAHADAGLDAYNFARGLYKAERWLQAEEAFRKFQADFPKHEQIPFGKLYLGLSQIQLEKHSTGRDTLDAFIKDYPKNTDVAHARYRVAECSYYLDELARAEKDFTSCLKDFPKDPFREFALFYLGDTQRRLGKSKEAVASLQSSISLFPQGRMAAEARFGLAQATEAAGDSARALLLYREAAKRTQEDRGDAAQLAIANLLFGQRKFQEAVNEYDAVGIRFPKSRLRSVATLNAGFALYQNNDFSNALAKFDEAEANPEQTVKAGY